MLKGNDIDVGTNTTYEFQPSKSCMFPTSMSGTGGGKSPPPCILSEGDETTSWRHEHIKTRLLTFILYKCLTEYGLTIQDDT